MSKIKDLENSVKELRREISDIRQVFLKSPLEKDIEREEIKKEYCANCGIAVSSVWNCSEWVAIPKLFQPKPPIIGELAIFWDGNKNNQAVIAIYTGESFNKNYQNNSNSNIYSNAILFESIEQYKTFIK